MEKLIEISGLSKAYGKKQALHNVDMVFEGGQIIGLLGPNGRCRKNRWNMHRGRDEGDGVLSAG